MKHFWAGMECLPRVCSKSSRQYKPEKEHARVTRWNKTKNTTLDDTAQFYIEIILFHELIFYKVGFFIWVWKFF